MRKQATNWEETFAKYYLTRGLLFRTYTALLQFNTTGNNPIKDEQNNGRDILPRKTYGLQIST